jgi:hypothetical protein
MRIIWKPEATDLKAVESLFETYKDHPMVKYRMKHNLATRRPTVAIDRFWYALVAALLTTQQRSGPSSPVARLICSKPFPLDYTIVRKARSPKSLFERTLRNSGGIRRHTIIATQLSTNLERMWDGGWKSISGQLNRLTFHATREDEIEVADFLADTFDGIGPKQARNLLQGLGLTQFEIPIDSRIAKWLNQHGFPFPISAAALSDRSYYALVMEGISQLCEACEISPCLLDAAIFVSYDGEGWNADNVGW